MLLLQWRDNCFKGLSECAQAQIAFKSEFVTNTVAFGESIGNLLPPVRVQAAIALDWL